MFISTNLGGWVSKGKYDVHSRKMAENVSNIISEERQKLWLWKLSHQLNTSSYKPRLWTFCRISVDELMETMVVIDHILIYICNFGEVSRFRGSRIPRDSQSEYCIQFLRKTSGIVDDIHIRYIRKHYQPITSIPADVTDIQGLYRTPLEEYAGYKSNLIHRWYRIGTQNDGIV